jgi:DNA-directed RNA polymerase subunit RPC12/RpoP
MGNPLEKSRRNRRKASQTSQRRKQPAKTTVPVETIQKIIHLHDIEHKGFRKAAAELGITKDRAYRLYKNHAATLKKQRRKMFSQDPQLIALKKTEREVERKKLRDQEFEEMQQKTKDHQIHRAHTSKGLEEIFSDPKEMGQFAEHIVKQYEALKLFCSERNLQPDETLASLMGSKEDYLRTEEETGEVQELPEYMGSTIEGFLMSQDEEEEAQRLVTKFYESFSKAKCQDCGSYLIEKSIIAEGKLVCRNCGARYYLICPRCKSRISAKAVASGTTDYLCPSCKLKFRDR